MSADLAQLTRSLHIRPMRVSNHSVVIPDPLAVYFISGVHLLLALLMRSCLRRHRLAELT